MQLLLNIKQNFGQASNFLIFDHPYLYIGITTHGLLLSSELHDDNIPYHSCLSLKASNKQPERRETRISNIYQNLFY